MNAEKTRKINGGSEWRKWDLHIHTPASFFWKGGRKLSEMNDREKDTEIKRFLKTINDSDVAVFAVMDYWTFDWYIILRKYLDSNSDELKKTVFPGMELRVECPVNYRLNIHVLLSDHVTEQQLNDFKSALQIRIGSSNKNVSNEALIEFARSLDESKARVCGYGNPGSLTDEQLLELGSKTAKITKDSLKKAFEHISKDSGYILLPYDTSDGLLRLDWSQHPQDDNYFMQTADIFESRDQRNIDLFNGRETGENKSFFKNFFKTLGEKPKPCVAGSDAHKFNDYGKYPSDKITWIKADTTFEGLKQIIYEPRDRVYIGNDDPSAFKQSVVNSFSVSDENDKFFLKQIGNISFSPGLNCVIGPRGAGKSTLLDVVVFSLGDARVLDADRSNYVGFFFGGNDADIITATVKHSSSGEEKKLSPDTAKDSGFSFDYYHQKYIGQLADPNSEEVLSRFLFNKIFEEGRGLDSLFSESRERRGGVISNLAINREKVVACEKEISREADIRGKIVDKNNRAEFLSQEEVRHLLKERNKIIKLREQVERIKARVAKVDEEPLITDEDVVDTNFFLELQLSSIDPEGTVIPKEWEDLEKNADGFVKSLDKNKEELNEQITELTDKVIELEPSFDFDTPLGGIWEQIQSESTKKGITITEDDLEKLDSIQKEVTVLEEQLKTIKGQRKEKAALLEERKNLIKGYAGYSGFVKERLETNFSDLLEKDGAILNDTIKLEVEINLSLESYLGVIENEALHESEDDLRFPNKKSLLELFEGLSAEKIVSDLRTNNFGDWNVRGFGSGGLDYFKKMKNKEEVAMYLEEQLPSLTARLLWRPDPLKEFKLLRNCSIGERGTALLSVILITGREPLIIDQPEDDLDHFYLHKTLTPIIKEVKKRRQLIFATHDANIVVNGDAELILITATKDGKFGEVIRTSIENLETRAKVIDILEGGKDAFKKRKQKYGKAVT